MSITIADDIRDWSINVLEVSNPDLPGGMPACPFARKAWLEDKVRIVECEDVLMQTILECGHFDPDRTSLVICASYNLPDANALYDWTSAMNDFASKADIHVMSFHPDFGAEDAELDFLYLNEWQSSLEEPYCMMFIQSLSQVDDASLLLENKGYYSVYPEAEYHELVIERRKRRNGYETS